jgi:lysophospholipase L1-like esterase
VWMLLFAVIFFVTGSTSGANGNLARKHWVVTWAASQQLLEPNNALDPEDLHDSTLRQIVHVSAGGTEIRVRLSNRFGNMPLHLAEVHVAKAASPSKDAIMSGSDRGLTFSGSPEVTIPAYADYLSDPVAFPLNPLSDLAISIHIDIPPVEQTGHPGSHATSYVARGDLVSAIDIPRVKTAEHWYFIAGVEVAAQPADETIVALGDSITDGHGTTTNGNDRWTDVLAQRLQTSPTTRHIAVLNQGIGGNRLLTDGIGSDALARFDHDVIAQPGVRYLIVLEGINDIGMLTRNGEEPQSEHDSLVHRMIGAYAQMIERAHSSGITVIGGTLLPFAGSDFYHPGAASEADWKAVNDWIRTPGHFDAIIDFDRIMRDPSHPERLLPAFDSGDHLHPSHQGYAAMGNAVPLSLFESLSDSSLSESQSEPLLKIATTSPPLFEFLNWDEVPHNREGRVLRGRESLRRRSGRRC